MTESNKNFAAAIQRIVNAPPDQIFESALAMFAEIQNMNEEQVVAFWRAVHMFWQLNPGRTSGPPSGDTAPARGGLVAHALHSRHRQYGRRMRPDPTGHSDLQGEAGSRLTSARRDD